MTTQLHTNRDLYCFVEQLLKTHKNNRKSLQDYLLSLWCLGSALESNVDLSLQCFTGLLETAFVAPTPLELPLSKLGLGASKRNSQEFEDSKAAQDGYCQWEEILRLQIIDLKDMKANGSLNDEYRYFGIDSPRGARWYNFDPCTYIECGAAGSFGGWEAGDSTTRCQVPGLVAVLDESDNCTLVNPQDIDDPVVEISSVSWEMFTEFLIDGQTYE